jgi:hypothetical protein
MTPVLIRIISALATPDSQSLPDTNWDAHDIHVRRDLDGSESEARVGVNMPGERWEFGESFPEHDASPHPEPR